MLWLTGDFLIYINTNNVIEKIHIYAITHTYKIFKWTLNLQDSSANHRQTVET